MNYKFEITKETVEDILDAYIVKTSWGAEVLILVPKSELTPEDIATLQALYSRSNKPILKKLIELLDAAKLANVTSRVVGVSHKGYGHKSIGDLGHILICYEGVSMLAAKAIQDSQLYAGQEASTRYIPFDKQPFLYHALNNAVLYATAGLDFDNLPAMEQNAENMGLLIQEKWRDAYLRWLPRIIAHLKQLPETNWDNVFSKIPDDLKPKDDAEMKKLVTLYDGAISARAFDIVRGFLPAGCSTNLAWWTSISHCSDHLIQLRCHALPEVQELAYATQFLVEQVYPNSFEGRIPKEARENYKTAFYEEEYYLENTSYDVTGQFPEPKFMPTIFDETLVPRWKKWIVERPVNQEMHYSVGECFHILYENLLDFASFRDQQRHRAVVQRQGLVCEKYGFHQWYLDSLPNDVRAEAVQLLQRQLERIKGMNLDKFKAQYLYPMGYKIPTKMVGPLGKMVYIIELRAQTTVHPTMHANAYDLAVRVREYLSGLYDGAEIPMNADKNVGAFSLKRGGQTLFVAGKDISKEHA